VAFHWVNRPVPSIAVGLAPGELGEKAGSDGLEAPKPVAKAHQNPRDRERAVLMGRDDAIRS
jgi:hypothetical protein